jgi:hypothetical protein
MLPVMAFFIHSTICIAQADGIYKVVNSHFLKGDIGVGYIIETDRKGTIKSILFSRNEILGFLTDTSVLAKKPAEQLASYGWKGSSVSRRGNIKAPNTTDLTLYRFDVKGDSINLFNLHKESLLYKNVENLVQTDKARDAIKRRLKSRNRNSAATLVTSLVYADSGIIQTNRKKGGGLQAKVKWTDSLSIAYNDTVKKGLITVSLNRDSPVFYSGETILRNGYNYKALIPFGIDNMLEKQYLKWASCLIPEAAGIGGFFYFRSERGKYKGYACNTLDDGKKNEYNRKANRMGMAQWGSIVVTALTYGLWDFLCDFSSEKKNSSSKYHAGNFQIAPYATIRDSGLALNFNF